MPADSSEKFKSLTVQNLNTAKSVDHISCFNYEEGVFTLVPVF